MNFTDGFSSGRQMAEKRIEDVIIRASNKAGLTRENLSDAFKEKGFMGIYNLGMQHMYEYLESKNEKTI